MTDWQDRWPEARPRWGTYSVKAHQRLDLLIADLLTYDVLVFPCPEDDAGHDRWEQEGWDPELLARRVTQLGDHAVVTPWDANLQAAWTQSWWALPSDDRDDPEAPFILTAAMMADLPLATLMGTADDRFGSAQLDRPTVHPAFAAAEGRARAEREQLEMVTAFQTQQDAQALTGVDGRSRERSQPAHGADAEGIRLRLELATPADATEDTLWRTLDLVQDEDFQRARRRLWSWERTLGPQSDERDLVAGLEALVADYDAAVRRQSASTRRSWVYLIVPVAVGTVLDSVTGGGVTAAVAGLGASVVLDRVKARFPALTGEAARASHHPGSAVEGLLAIAGPAAPPV